MSRPSNFIQKNSSKKWAKKNPQVIISFDGTPVPRGLAWILLDARRNGGWKGRLNSADRRKGIPEAFNKKSQWALWQGWLKRLPGFNPANKPGMSTHEYINDGSAYPKEKRGKKLHWWQLGLDVSDSQGLLNALKKLGYSAKRPYNVASEYHHINLTRNPWEKVRKRFKKIKI